MGVAQPAGGERMRRLNEAVGFSGQSAAGFHNRAGRGFGDGDLNDLGQLLTSNSGVRTRENCVDHPTIEGRRGQWMRGVCYNNDSGPLSELGSNQAARVGSVLAPAKLLIPMSSRLFANERTASANHVGFAGPAGK
jgi:hypothetical protein